MSLVILYDGGGGVKKKKRVPVHRRKEWQCPYFKWDGAACVSCETGLHDFPSRERANGFMDEYCAGDWRACSIAKQWNDYFELWEDFPEDERPLFCKYKKAASVGGK